MTSVIYLTDTRFGHRAWEHPSARHRCYHFADALIASGDESLVVPLERVSVKILERFDHAIFHRPSYSKRFEHAFSCCEKASVSVHADYDDLIFLPAHAVDSPLYITGNRSLDKVTLQFEKNYQAAGFFGSFILSTRFLRDKLLNAFPDAVATVVPNALPRLFARPESLASDDAPLTIGYFPGSNGHGEDFNLIKPALARVVDNSSGSTRVLVTGKLGKQHLDGIANLTHLPYVNYSKYLEILASVDISIAPLTDSVFNNSKSAVKLIESVSVGTPIVASSNGDMHDHANQMARLLDDPFDWYQALTETLMMAREKRDENCRLAVDLANKYSINSRIPVLQDKLQCAA